MHRGTLLGVALAATVSLFLVFTQTAYASVDAGSCQEAARAYYIDPGTGSIVIQVVIGALVAGAAMIGVYRARVNMFLRSLFARRKQEKEGGDGQEPE